MIENYLENNFFNKKIIRIPIFISSFIGLLAVTKKLLNCVAWLKKNCFTFAKNFEKEYGNGWVLITGSSDGLGKSYAKEFLKRGSKVLLCARDENKLKSTIEELKNLNSKSNSAEIEYFVYDFNNSYKYENLEELKQKLEKYEIKILINNVGTVYIDNFENLSDESIHATIQTNLMSATFLTKILMKKMIQRENRSLIVFVGSDFVKYNPPYAQIYNASKGYLDVLSYSLAQESDKIDFTYLVPGPLKTTLNPRKIPFKVDSDDYAAHSIRHFGKYTNSHGHWLHDLKFLIYGNSVIYNLITKHSLKKELSPLNKK